MRAVDRKLKAKQLHGLRCPSPALRSLQHENVNSEGAAVVNSTGTSERRYRRSRTLLSPLVRKGRHEPHVPASFLELIWRREQAFAVRSNLDINQIGPRRLRINANPKSWRIGEGNVSIAVPLEVIRGEVPR